MSEWQPVSYDAFRAQREALRASRTEQDDAARMQTPSPRRRSASTSSHRQPPVRVKQEHTRRRHDDDDGEDERQDKDDDADDDDDGDHQAEQTAATLALFPAKSQSDQPRQSSRTTCSEMQHAGQRFDLHRGTPPNDAPSSQFDPRSQFRLRTMHGTPTPRAELPSSYQASGSFSPFSRLPTQPGSFPIIRERMPGMLQVDDMLDDFSNDSSPEDACDDSALLLGALPTQSSDIFTPGAAFSASQAQFSSQPSQQQPFPSTADSQPQQCSPAPLTVAQANTPFILKSQPVKPTTPFSKFSFALSQNLNFGGASAKKALDLANDDALSDIGALEHDDQHHALDSGVPLMPATPHTQQPPPSTLQLAVDMATTTPAAMRFFDLSHHSANNSAAIAGLSSARTALPPGVDYDSDALEFDDNDQTDAGEHADFPSTPPPRAPNESGDGATTLSAGAAWFKLTDPASSSSSSSFRTPRKDYHGASGVDASDMSPSSSHRRKRVQLVPAGLAERLEKLALAERSELSFWQYNNRRMASATASALGPSFTSAMQAAVPSVPLEDLLVVELLQDFVQCHCYFVRCKVVSGTTRSRVFTVNLANKLSTAAPSQPSQQLSQQSFAVVDILMDLVTCRRLSLTLGSKLELHPPWREIVTQGTGIPLIIGPLFCKLLASSPADAPPIHPTSPHSPSKWVRNAIRGPLLPLLGSSTAMFGADSRAVVSTPKGGMLSQGPNSNNKATTPPSALASASAASPGASRPLTKLKPMRLFPDLSTSTADAAADQGDDVLSAPPAAPLTVYTPLAEINPLLAVVNIRGWVRRTYQRWQQSLIVRTAAGTLTCCLLQLEGGGVCEVEFPVSASTSVLGTITEDAAFAFHSLRIKNKKMVATDPALHSMLTALRKSNFDNTANPLQQTVFYTLVFGSSASNVEDAVVPQPSLHLQTPFVSRHSSGRDQPMSLSALLLSSLPAQRVHVQARLVRVALLPGLDATAPVRSLQLFLADTTSEDAAPTSIMQLIIKDACVVRADFWERLVAAVPLANPHLVLAAWDVAFTKVIGTATSSCLTADVYTSLTLT